MATALFYDPFLTKHFTGEGFPECPHRTIQAFELLKKQPWYPQLTLLSAKKAASEILQMVHTLEYIQRANTACLIKQPYLDSPDVPICPDSFEAALLAVGAAIALGDAVMEKKISNGFGLLRPPGHHAEAGHAMGFCLFNNIAILARYLQKKHGIARVMILDWDVHHGNGTQHSFEEDPSVLYISLHQWPFYPGTGAADERGKGKGEGFTLNCPLPAASSDRDYQHAFEKAIWPKVNEFKPEFVLISAGFDAHRSDPLGGMNLSEKCFHWMTLEIMAMAEKYASGRVVSLLEGGYNLSMLPICIAEHLKGLIGIK